VKIPLHWDRAGEQREDASALFLKNIFGFLHKNASRQKIKKVKNNER
jgi:hypothetical protein